MYRDTKRVAMPRYLLTMLVLALEALIAMAVMLLAVFIVTAG
jgi:hypothetical protein